MKHDYEVDKVLLGFWAAVLLSAMIWLMLYVAMWGMFE
jgi:hypothetical protein